MGISDMVSYIARLKSAYLFQASKSIIFEGSYGVGAHPVED